MTTYWESFAVLILLGALFVTRERKRAQDARDMAAVEEILERLKPRRHQRRDFNGRWKRTYGHFPVRKYPSGKRPT
jgi:hypothetical protein